MTASAAAASSSASSSPSVDRSARYCIVGAGPAGLAAARALGEAGIPFDVLERHGDVGGIWDPEHAGSPMYESAHFISSKTLSAFPGFPMPGDYPDYPGWRQILAYLRAFADRFGLREHVEFHAAVERVAPAGDGNGGWDVTLESGEWRRYRGVVLAVGHNYDPVLPVYPGRFDGEAYHSVSYRSADQLRGKRVLVVGGGNSGCDIACDAATGARRALISLRRGYHFLPKHVFGKPTDEFFRSGPELPTWLAQPLLTGLLRLLVGDLTRHGLRVPDHKVLESHPIMNTQLIHHLAHGDIAARPDVRELRGRRVRFADGSEEEVDTIIYATGYRASIPCVDTALLGDPTGSDLYLTIFPPAHRDLFVVGRFETDGGAYPVVTRQAELIAAVIRARESSPAAAARFDALARGPRPDLSHGVKYIDSPRHSIYVQYEAYGRAVGRVLEGLHR